MENSGTAGAILSQEQIQSFIRDGVVVIPNVLTKHEIEDSRKKFHQELAAHNVDHTNLQETAQNLKNLSSTGGAGGILDIFYSAWRFELAQHPKIFQVITELWEATYATDNPLFDHPHGNFNPKHGFMYVNRVCYRVPDSLSKLHAQRKNRPLQRSLTPHLDCCPTTLYDSGKEFPRWRPIQCITALTPNHEPSTGGFEAVKGFHHEFDEYFKSNPISDANEADNSSPPVCLGDFSPMRMSVDKGVIERFEHIPYSEGSVVLWDWRLPHANSYCHLGQEPREVVYTGFLPAVPVNAKYAAEQLRRYKLGLLPADHWQNQKQESQAKKTSCVDFDFSSLGSKLIGAERWDDSGQ